MADNELLNAYNASIYFSSNLIKCRKSLGMTQQQIAERLGIDRTTYTKYETGYSEPGFEMLLKLSRLLSVSLDELFSHSGDDPLIATVSDFSPEELSGDEIDLIVMYRRLNEEEKKRFREDLAEKAAENNAQ